MNWMEKAHLYHPMPPAPELPPRYESAEITGLPVGDIRRATIDYLKQFKAVALKGIAPVFLGAARVAKTAAAAVLAREIWQRFQVEVLFLSWGATLPLLETMRYTEEFRQLLDRWYTVPVLVVDDFAITRPDSFGADILRGIVSARFEALLPTIWTANLDLPSGREYAAIQDQYGPLFARRLQDAGAGFTVVVDKNACL